MFHRDKWEDLNTTVVERLRSEVLVSCIGTNDLQTKVSSLTIFPYGEIQIEPDWENLNDSESCQWLIDNSLKSKMIWKTHRSKKYRYIQEGCEVSIKQDASQKTTSMELDIGNHPGRVCVQHIYYSL